MPLAAAVVAFVQPVDFDYWWQRRTGEYIVTGGGIPRHDIFSFSVAGTEWTDHEWLAQVAMYAIDASIGYLALFVAFIALGVAAYALVYGLLRSRGATEMQAALLTLPIAVFGATYWRPRPAMFTVLFMTLFLIELTRARAERRSLWWLAAAMALWANLHGGYVLGLGLLAMFSLAQRLDGGGAGTTWKRGAAVAALAFAATAISPYTYKLWLYPVSYLVGDNASLELVDEWKSADFHELRSIPFGALLLATMVAGVATRRFDAWRTCLVLVFGAMALQSMRHQPLFAIVWSVAVGLSVIERWPAWGGAVRRDSAATAMNWALLAGGLAALATVIAVSPQGLPTRDPPVGGSNAVPFSGADFIVEYDPHARVFNEYGWGGYLIDRIYPSGGRVFIDGRADVYGGLVRDYVRATRGDGWEQVFARHEIDMALLPPYLPLVRELRAAGWVEVLEDDVQVLLVAPDYEPSP
jgi:hypothetical protein